MNKDKKLYAIHIINNDVKIDEFDIVGESDSELLVFMDGLGYHRVSILMLDNVEYNSGIVYSKSILNGLIVLQNFLQGQCGTYKELYNKYYKQESVVHNYIKDIKTKERTKNK